MPVHGVMTLAVEDGLGPLEQADLILLPGIMDCSRPQPAHLLEALRRAHARGARIASVCTGAFVLAQAGCWTAAAPPPTGGAATSCAPASPRSRSIPRCSTSTRATF